MQTGLMFCMLVAAGCAAGSAIVRNVVWLEAERFDDHGGWTNDAQFIDRMGSPYLMAIGLGQPVKDAVTTFAVPRPGRYRLWTRTKDWAPAHHPGRFRILLNGRPVERILGESGETGWRWEDSGVHELRNDVELRLRDLTGYYTRCDAVVLADDLAWTPPADKDAIAELRERHGGVSRGVKDAGEYDVVVVGGGLAGCTAAVAAARMGARTALLQNRPVLGGNASTEILVPPVGVWPHGKAAPGPLDPRETGLVEEYRTEGNQRVAEGKLYEKRLLRWVKAEPNLELHLNTHATGVEMAADEAIGAVLAANTRSGQRLRFRGRIFIDATGDGVVGVAAGAEHRHGREPRALYDEPGAPIVGDRQTMGNSIKYASVPTDQAQPFEPPRWAMRFPKCEDFPPGRHPRLGGEIGWQWMLELGGRRDTYADAEEIRDDLLRLVFGIWDHVKNHCPQHREAAASHKLAWVGHIAGKRENRRLIGDYVLTENDIIAQTLFPDRVAYGGWSMDDHHPDGFFYWGRPVPAPAAKQFHGHRYSIPYRCLYSRNIRNLLMAGRDISASHRGLANTRVMLTCAVIGQAAGAAAGLCTQRQATPRGVHESYLADLQQQLLKDGAHIIALPNRDPRDLARHATPSASSERTGERGEVMAASNVIDGFARAADGKTYAWGPKPDDQEPWLQLAWEQPQALNVVHVTFLTKRHAPRCFAVQAWRDDAWRTVAEATVGCFRRHVLGLGRVTTPKLRIVLFGAERRDVGICEIRAYDEPPRVVETARRAARIMRLRDEPPDLPWSIGHDPRKLPGIVLEHAQAELTGHWVQSSFTGPFVSDGYIHDGNEDKGAKEVCFRPQVPKAGAYEIRLAYTAYGNRATNVPVTIETAQGSRTIRINQRQKPPIDGLFLSLGAFHLEAGDATRIVVGNAGTDGYVVVDAVQILTKQER